jgi:hypothetical protein
LAQLLLPDERIEEEVALADDLAERGERRDPERSSGDFSIFASSGLEL